MGRLGSKEDALEAKKKKRDLADYYPFHCDMHRTAWCAVLPKEKKKVKLAEQEHSSNLDRKQNGS